MRFQMGIYAFLGAVALAFVGGLGEALVRGIDPFGLGAPTPSVLLPRFKSYEIRNRAIPSLPAYAMHRKNARGFRGPDLTERPDALTLVAVGGSTTECLLLDEGSDWPQRAGKMLSAQFPSLLVNNAGLDGHSTFAHERVLQEAVLPLRPDMVLLLVGMRDQGLKELSEKEQHTVFPRFKWSFDGGMMRRLTARSQLLASTFSLSNRANVETVGITFLSMHVSWLPEIEPLARHQKRAKLRFLRELPAYRDRLLHLVRAAKQAGSEPVLITHPALYGPGIDPITGVDLGRIEVWRDTSGQDAWDVLERYNDETRRVGRKTGVPVIDLARAMPRSSAYYYDLTHFTVDGAEKVAEILHDALCPILARSHPAKLKQPCSSAAAVPTDRPATDLAHTESPSTEPNDDSADHAEEKLAAEKAAEEKAAEEKAAEEKAAEEKAATEKLAAEKATEEKAAMEKLAVEKAAKKKTTAPSENDLLLQRLRNPGAKKVAEEKDTEEETALSKDRALLLKSLQIPNMN